MIHSKVKVPFLFIGLLFNFQLCLQDPHPPKVKSILFSFFHHHFLVWSLEFHLYDKYFFKLTQNHSLKTITWNYFLSFKTICSAIIRVPFVVVQILCWVAHTKTYMSRLWYVSTITVQSLSWMTVVCPAILRPSPKYNFIDLKSCVPGDHNSKHLISLPSVTTKCLAISRPSS